jgi:hypothetical protein
MSVFETETMAELCVKQGLVTEALAIYRRLVDGAPDEATRARRAARLAALERTAAGAARAKGEPRPAAPPPAPGEPWLTLERRGDALTFTWSLPAQTRGPALQLLLVRRGADGVETETRTLPVDAPSGTTTLTMRGLHSVRAAAGWLDGERFVPLARIAP